MIVYLTRAHCGVAGQTVLILGAAGGVGVAAVQISKVLGAKVVAVARGESKAKLLRDLGADAVIDTSANHQVRCESPCPVRGDWTWLSGADSFRELVMPVMAQADFCLLQSGHMHLSPALQQRLPDSIRVCKLGGAK